MRNMVNKHTVLKVYAYGTLLLAMAFILFVGFWLTYPYKTISISKSPHKIVSASKVKGGEYITYRVRYTKHTKIEPIITQQFVDGVIFKISEEYVTNFEPSKDGYTLVKIQIPPTLPTGTYHIQTDMYYNVNPIRTIHIESHTECFTVVK